jgi:hypothetical protein
MHPRLWRINIWGVWFDSRPTRGEDVKMNSCLGSKIVAALEVFNCMWDSRLDCVLWVLAMDEGILLLLRKRGQRIWGVRERRDEGVISEKWKVNESQESWFGLIDIIMCCYHFVLLTLSPIGTYCNCVL